MNVARICQSTMASQNYLVKLLAVESYPQTLQWEPNSQTYKYHLHILSFRLWMPSHERHNTSHQFLQSFKKSYGRNGNHLCLELCILIPYLYEYLWLGLFHCLSLCSNVSFSARWRLMIHSYGHGRVTDWLREVLIWTSVATVMLQVATKARQQRRHLAGLHHRHHK